MSLGLSSLQLKTTGLEVWNQAGSQPTNVQTATLCVHHSSFISALHHLLRLAFLATLPGILSLNLSIMKSHLLNNAFRDYPSSKPNVELDTVFSGLPETFQQAVDTLSCRSWALKSELKAKTAQNKTTLGESLKSPISTA